MANHTGHVAVSLSRVRDSAWLAADASRFILEMPKYVRRSIWLSVEQIGSQASPCR